MSGIVANLSILPIFMKYSLIFLEWLFHVRANRIYTQALQTILVFQVQHQFLLKEVTQK